MSTQQKSARLSFIRSVLSASDPDTLTKARIDFRATTGARPKFALVLVK